jgi:competence protein ComEC
MRRPLIYLLIALICGIFAGSYLNSCYYPLLTAVALNLFLLLITLRKKWPITGLFLILSLTFLLGVFNIQKQIYLTENDQNISRFINKGKVTMEGIVIESPLSRLDNNVLIVRCMRVIQGNSYVSTSGDIRLVIPSDLNFQYGDFIRFHSTLRKIQSFQNPGSFNYEHILNIQGIYASGFINNNAEIILLRNNSASGMRLKLESFRNYLKQIIYNNASSPQREVIEAMTIGNQNKIPADLRDNFNKTGTAHLLSINGLHIGIIAASAFFFVFLVLKSSEYMMLRFNIIKLAAAAAFIMVMICALIAGMRIPVLRSTLMAFVFLVALLNGKQRDFYNILAIAALIILLISPEALFDSSFQLSFVAVLALIYMMPRLGDLHFKKESCLPLWTQSVIRYAYLSALVCIAVTIGTLPLIVYYSNRVSSITIIANLISVPLLGTLSLTICMFFILCAFFSPIIAGYCIKLASFFVGISVNIINKLAAIPWSSFNVTTPNLLEIAIFYFFIFLTMQFIDAIRNRKTPKAFSLQRLQILKYLLIITVLFFVADITYLTFKDKLSSDLKVTVIDVGQGNSTLIQFPGGKTMMIDGGGFADSSFDVGKSVLAPFLYHRRISNIDMVALSHPHPDHLLGLIYIMNNFAVRQVWRSNLPIDLEEFPEWGKAISRNNIDVHPVSNQSPERIFNGVRVNVLWPPDYPVKDLNNLSYVEINDSSVVLKITYGKVKFLVPGDITSDTEKQLIESKSDIKSDVLVVPHHGSVYSSSAEFIKAVGCRYAIVSAGKSNIFHHPHPLVLQRYNEAGVRVFRTDRDGAITFITDGNKLNIVPFVKKDNNMIIRFLFNQT